MDTKWYFTRYRVASKHMKEAYKHMKEAYNIFILEWLKLKSLATPSVGKHVKKLELLYTAGRNVKQCDHFEKQF